MKDLKIFRTNDGFLVATKYDGSNIPHQQSLLIKNDVGDKGTIVIEVLIRNTIMINDLNIIDVDHSAQDLANSED